MSDDYDDDSPADAEYLKNYVPPAPSDPAESLDQVREAALRAGLEAYELDERDLATLEGEPAEQREALPILAIVGRPNVGKSTLINRIIGRRLAVVEDTPGVTRDRVTYQAEWAGRDFMLMDTGGWEAGVHGIDLSVAQSAEAAMDLADAMLFVVDATVGPTATDEKVVKLLRKTKKPVVLVANKVDGPQGELEAAALWNLGLGEPYPVSALHGRGVGDLLDVAVAALPTEARMVDDEGSPRRVALVGRPNVGKSSLLNKLADSERAVVNELAGTTRDPVDELIEVDGELFTFIDTAGIRRRVHLSKGADYYASLRTSAAIQRAELALVLLDGSVPLTEQDLRILSEVVDAGRAIVMVINKWDLVGEEERFMFERSFEKDLTHLTWAARVNLSALTGWHTNRLKRSMDEALTNWDRRISTGKLNTFLGELVAAHPHPVRGGKQPKILFATQATTRPPTFVLFTSGFLDPQYRRYIERRLRETFDFRGTPIHISVRVREKRGKR
ncbi:ribosome biogenesis GTPase Der [Demequina sp.]|uniref:ribosome biogenesis GTPase Der n=1 Tax=Demequina sp. TaxID=2050685 RepID=UPI0025B7B0EE|nr:ribosome biogenesis GTPase Der [Demequina sp.]